MQEETSRILFLGISFALLGWILTTRAWLKWANKFSPIGGLFIYYSMVAVILWVLSRSGLVVAGIAVDSPVKIIGSVLIIFSFFIVVNLESAYVAEELNSGGEVPTLYYHSEDGAVYEFWSRFVSSRPTRRLLTFVVTPLVLAVIGGYLLVDRPTLSIL